MHPDMDVKRAAEAATERLLPGRGARDEFELI
jgi:hypothetical protein